MTERRYQDFSEMPDDVLRSFAYDLAHPREAMKRIRAKRKATKAADDGECAPVKEG